MDRLTQRDIRKQNNHENEYNKEYNKECVLICCIIIFFHVSFIGSILYLMNQEDISFSSESLNL